MQLPGVATVLSIRDLAGALAARLIPIIVGGVWNSIVHQHGLQRAHLISSP